MSVEALRDSLPEEHRALLDPEGPVPPRMMAARGLSPLPPREMVVVLSGLALDENEQLALNAKTSLEKLPETILGPVLDADLPAEALSIVTPFLISRAGLLEKVLLNRATPDDAIASVASDVSEHLAEIIISNQERCLRSKSIVGAIRRNGALPRASLDRLFDFLVRSGVIYEEMPEFSQAIVRLSPSEMDSMAGQVELPEVIGEFVGDEAADASELVEEQAREPMLKLISQLTAAQKVALAIRGNREARNILIRDSNRIVATAAIRNPRITDAEVLAAAQNRTMCDEVIRLIAMNKEMIRAYPVKLALVQNPKTPLPTAMRFLSILRASDLKNVAKSKGVPQALANQAKRLSAKKGR
uniref:Uncharacterized protein n=1 Tax=uncultured myxobacterium HF0130_06F04 TaxID=723555 RepID=E7C2G2_9BACT|nr:hypothetical protein [uncultured myxobacterium HF0130_06F04]